ncbi:MAG: hypothetical protein HC894_11225 [Microcoleus sp. SM1_3_4]|nr:hypothetical protein [Microcoleus sp. SM1_3_4]
MRRGINSLLGLGNKQTKRINRKTQRNRVFVKLSPLTKDAGKNPVSHHNQNLTNRVCSNRDRLSTINSQLSTLNSQLSTLNSQLSTLNSQLSTIYQSTSALSSTTRW